MKGEAVVMSATQLPLTRFCYGTRAQLECLSRFGVRCVEDLWRHIAATTSPVEEANLPLVVHKRHVIGFCTHRCRGIFFDFGKLYREAGVVAGGAWPNQWIALRVPAAPRPAVWVDDEAALAEAIRQSLELAARCEGASRGSSGEEGPLELCCPITLELFRDPVKTLHGQTYERAAIEE